MRIVIFTKELNKNLDEAISKVAYELGTKLLAKEHEVLTIFSTGDAIENKKLVKIPLSRLAISRKLWAKMRQFHPDVVIYLPRASATLYTFLRAKLLKWYGGSQRSIMLVLQPNRFNLFSKWLASMVKPDLVLTVSRKTERGLTDMGCQTRFMPLWVDGKKFRQATSERKRELRLKYGLNPASFIVLHIGHINEYRNLRLLNTIQNKEQQVVILGSTSTPQDSELYKELQADGIKFFTDYIYDTQELYQLADCYLFPTINETASINIPLSILEAMSCNLPVVTTRFGGLPDLFPVEENGLFYAENAADFSLKVNYLRQNISTTKINTRTMVEVYSHAKAEEQIREIIQTLKIKIREPHSGTDAVLKSNIMDILLYMPGEGETEAVKTHVFEVLYNLSLMGHSIRYINGKIYKSTPVEKLETETQIEQHLGLWDKIKQVMAHSVLRGEALVFWSFLKEIGLLFTAIATVLRHKPDIIYRRHSLFNSDYFIAKLFHIPSVREVNGLVTWELDVTKRAGNIVLGFINWIERFSIARADKIIVVTSKLKEALQNEYGVPEEKIVIINNGANTDLFRPINKAQARKKLGLDPDADYICFVGYLERWQGVEYLIQHMPLIIERCPKTQLLIIGEGPIKQELVEQAESIGITRKVKFTGSVPYSKVPVYIGASDVCALLKIDAKSGMSPLKLYEYMACEKPVVASRVDGLGVVEEFGTGFLVNREDGQQVAQAFCELLNNEKLRKQQGENGRKYVVENHSWQSVGYKVADVCQSVLKKKKQGSKR
jgi:glycosyltransferase involved in cell wall biosynthesis